ncbi:MAG: hypothetical protein QM786_19015 [Breznakibacter sp.]
MLVNSDRFKNDSSFDQLKPKYAVTGKEIETFMVEKVKNAYIINLSR